MKLHFGDGAGISARTDEYSHETHEKTRNFIFISVRFRGFRGQQYPLQLIQLLSLASTYQHLSLKK
jgi:hypothetical protein